MKYAWLFVVMFTSVLLISCSELKDDQSIVSSQMEKTSGWISNNGGFAAMTKFEQIPVKTWSPTSTEEGIEITLGTSMNEVDNVFAIVEHSDLSQSELIFLQKVNDVCILPRISDYDIKDIRVYGINTTREIGQYPFGYLFSFRNFNATYWDDGGSSVKVFAEQWNSSCADLFAEINSDTEQLLVYIGNPRSKDFELPKFGLTRITGINLFATRGNSELPLD